MKERKGEGQMLSGLCPFPCPATERVKPAEAGKPVGNLYMAGQEREPKKRKTPVFFRCNSDGSVLFYRK